MRIQDIFKIHLVTTYTKPIKNSNEFKDVFKIIKSGMYSINKFFFHFLVPIVPVSYNYIVALD